MLFVGIMMPLTDFKMSMFILLIATFVVIAQSDEECILDDDCYSKETCNDGYCVNNGFEEFIVDVKETCDNKFKIGESTFNKGEDTCRERCRTNPDCNYYFYTFKETCNDKEWCVLYKDCSERRIPGCNGRTFRKTGLATTSTTTTSKTTIVTDCKTLVIGPTLKGPKKLAFDQEYKCPTYISKNVWLNAERNGDTFTLTKDGMDVEVERTDNGDRTQGWGMNLKIECCKTYDVGIGNSFQKIESGTFCFSKDLDYLRTEEECKIAAKTLDIPYGKHFAGDKNPSCVYDEDKNKIFFNRNGRARCLKNRCRSKMGSKYAAICKEKGPEYEHATPTFKKCNGDWDDCGRSCDDCAIEKDEYCDGRRGVCMRVKNCEFMDFWFDGSSAWRKAGFGLLGLDYNKKDEAIDKCHNTPGCTGVFLKMPEGVWALSDGEHPKPRYKGEGTIAIPMKCMEDYGYGWNVVLQHTSMVGPAIHNKSPIYYRGNSTEWTGTRARVAYKVPNEDAWIIGAQDGGALKMVKIQVTGANTYRWIRTKYRYNVCSTEVCINQEYDRSCIYKWFNESCFDAGVDNSNAYHVLLVAKKGLPQSSWNCLHMGVLPMGESCHELIGFGG